MIIFRLCLPVIDLILKPVRVTPTVWFEFRCTAACPVIFSRNQLMRHHTIDFEALRYVLVAAGVGTFGEAAKAVGIGTASLSRRISRVEDELGLTLFERSHAGIRLTKAGRAAIVHVRRALGNLDAIISTGQGDASGEIGLGIRLPLVGDPIQSLLRAWRTRHPQIRLKVHELNDRDLLSAIEERRLDLAFMSKHTLWAGAASIPIYRERLLLALPKAHPLGRRKTLGLERIGQPDLSRAGLGGKPDCARIL